MSTYLFFCRFCDLNDFPGVIYDHECTGESNFGDPIINNTKDVLFSHWIQDVHAVIDQLTEGPIVLVGCSMGGNENLKTLLVQLNKNETAPNFIQRNQNLTSDCLLI